MRILDLITTIGVVIVVALVIAVIIWFIVIWFKDAKKQTARDASNKNHAPHQAWVDKVQKAGQKRPSIYNVAQVEAPPESIGGEDHTFIHQLEYYEWTRNRVEATSKYLAETKLVKDPIQQRDRLLALCSRENELSPKDSEWVDSRILEICRQQTDTLWIKAKGGDIDALGELIAFTQRRYGVFRDYTGRSYVEPDGWLEVISEHFEAPSLDLLRTEKLDDSALLLLAQTAIRTNSIVRAKIVLAHWVIGKKYQLLIPQTMIETIVEMVEQYHAMYPVTRRIEV